MRYGTGEENLGRRGGRRRGRRRREEGRRRSRAGQMLKRLEREDTQNARGLERQMLKGVSMGFYALLKGANLEPSSKCSSQFIRDEQRGLMGDPEEIL